MTRKRFIKLLMSRGEQKRTAQATAYLYNARKVPYAKAYSDYRIRVQITKAFRRLGEVVARAGQSILETARAVGWQKDGADNG